MTRIRKVSFVIFCIILFGSGCLSFPETFASGPCSQSPFVRNPIDFSEESYLRIGYYSQESFFTVDLAGENKIAWVNGVYPMWSPDQNTVAYVEADSLCFANYDGRQIRTALQGGDFRELSWSPDGQFMVYGTFPEGHESDIYMVSLAGEITQLTFSPDISEGSPVWSPDSKEIAFVTYSDPVEIGGNVEYTITISILNMISKEIRVVTQDGLLPRWSPDGTKLLFESPDNRICVVDVDGANRSCLTFGSTDYGAQWSPDGTQIAFTREWEIYTMNADGSDQIWLASGIFPVWSPDGKHIAYATGIETSYVNVVDLDDMEYHLIAEDASGYIWFQP